MAIKKNRDLCSTIHLFFHPFPLPRLPQLHQTKFIQYDKQIQTSPDQCIWRSRGVNLGGSSVVRKRAGLDPIAEADLTANLIHIERMKELAFENDRLYYLQALSLPIPAGDRADQSTIPWNDARFAMPIPASETDLNPGAR